jgi:hypothetical protein
MQVMRWLLCAAFSITIACVQGQPNPLNAPFRHELSFINENDAYLFREHDAYYTNGIFLAFRWAKERNGKKQVHKAELGQKIYTPLIRKTRSAADVDRPYCGFLYGRYQQTSFLQKESMLSYSITLGTVGEASLGENVQNAYHSLFGYGRFTGWQYQVRNAVGADLAISYARTLWEDSSWIKLVPQVQASLGMNDTHAAAGMYFCLGSLESNRNSALWNARVQSAETALRKKHELFVYWYPEIRLQGYNATVQGGLFSKGEGAVLAEPSRCMFRHTTGICYANTRITLQLGITFESREAISQKTPQQYGSVMMAYRMK